MACRLQLRHYRNLSTAAARSSAETIVTPSVASSSSCISISQTKIKLQKEFDADKALDIYSSLSKDNSSPVNTRYVQELTVRRLAKSRRFSDIEALLESHKKDPKIKEEPFLTSLIRSYGVAGLLDHAIRTFHQMDQLRTPRSSVSFNALLFACVQSRQFNKVPRLFDEIPRRYQVSPDKISYGILIKSYCEAGDPKKGMEVVRDMEMMKMEVSTLVFTTVLHGFYKKGMEEEAEKLWSDMLRKGCELDAAAYNVRIMNISCGDPEKVKQMMDDMSISGLKPDTKSYNYLMTSYCKSGMMEEAGKVYEGLESNGCKPNAATFRTLIFYMCRNEEYEKAYKVFKVSVEKNKIPDFNTMKHLVEGLVKKKKQKLAKGLVRTAKKKFPPNLQNAWRKLEENLGLVSVESESAEKQEATG